MKILVVEENVTMASALRYMLRHMGFTHIVELNDGAEALELMRREMFDLVILDWVIPSLSGVALVKWMRSTDAHERTPVIMVTTKDQAEDVLVAVEAGVDEYVLKPLDREVLRAKVEKMVERRRRESAA